MKDLEYSITTDIKLATGECIMNNTLLQPFIICNKQSTKRAVWSSCACPIIL